MGVQTDANIVRSMRMVDGMQKKCLSLSSVQSLNTSNNANAAYKPNSSWSHSQQQQAPPQHPQSVHSQSQSWDYKNRNQQNEGGSGFDLRRGASQSDAQEQQQQQFPAYGSRNMWQ